MSHAAIVCNKPTQHLNLIISFSLVFLQYPVISKAQCTESSLKERLEKSFKVLKLGRTRRIKSCINLCCSSRNCDLALLRKTRCYGISCLHHDLCRGIMNGLRMKRHEISKRNIEDTEGKLVDRDTMSIVLQIAHKNWLSICNSKCEQ